MAETQTSLQHADTERFLSSLSGDGYAANTVRAYRSDLRTFWRDAGSGVTSPEELATAARIWLNTHRESLTPKTTERRLTTLRAFAKFLGINGFLETYRLPVPAAQIPHPLPNLMSDVRAMASVARTVQEKALIVFCGMMGMRVHEALGVRPSDIDFNTRSMLIHGKGGKDRIVPMTDDVWTQIGMAVVEAFVSGKDERVVMYGDRVARRKITSLGKLAGVPVLVASHDLRMTFATALYKKTKNILLVQQMLGHSDVKTTMRYIQVDMNELRELIEL